MQRNTYARRYGVAAVALLTATSLALVAFPSPAPANPLAQFAPTIYAFGDNQYGQLGNDSGLNTTSPQSTPVKVVIPDLSPGATGLLPTTVAAAAVGANHSLVLTTGGALYAFGQDTYGQLGNAIGIGNVNSSLTPVPLPAGAGAVTALAAGFGHSLVVTATGRLYAFGYNQADELGTNGPATSVPTQVIFPQPRLGAGIQDQPKITAVAAGVETSYAISSTGVLYAFGDDESGEVGLPAAAKDLPVRVTLPGENGPVTQVAAGVQYALALTSSGQLYAFGDNHFGELGSATTSEAPAPVTLPAGQRGAITQVAAGGGQTLVLTASGQLYSFGLNFFGELGYSNNVGTTDANPTPRLVPVPSGNGPVRQIAANGHSSFAVTANGTLYAWGDNTYGALGYSANAGSIHPNPDPVPVSLPGGAAVETIARGADAKHTLAIVSSLAVSTTALTAGRVGTPYSETVAATGGVAPYSWSATGLPHGLAISASGQITGKPTAAGSASVILTVTDADGIEYSRPPITLTVAAASPTTTSGSTTTGPTSSVSLSARLRSQLAPHVTIGKLLRAGAYRLTLHGLAGAGIAIRWRHRTSSHGSPVLVASGTAHLTASKLVVTIRLTAAGRRLLAHARRLGLTVAATLTPAASKAVSVTLTVTLTRHQASA